jgi:alkylation response protein AidB-like acyl-CoA dehydrogenase
MFRIVNDLDFEAENQVGQDILSRKTNVANACVGVAAKAMEIVGGPGFYRSFGLERLFRDVQGARYHPLPELEQRRFLGEFVIGKDHSANDLVLMTSTRVERVAA